MGIKITSKEVAEVTGKRHSDVLRDIRKILEQGVDERNFAFTFIIKELQNGGRRECPIYILTKKGALILASGYSAKLREAIINRCDELEKRRIAEEHDPSLLVDRAVGAWKRKGKSAQWITTRTQGIIQRHTFTDTLKLHGVEGQGYANCTNAIYKPILGGTKKEIAMQRNIPSKAPFRDNLDCVELSAVMLSEALATERIDNNNAQGNNECTNHSKIAATHVSRAVTASRK